MKSAQNPNTLKRRPKPNARRPEDRESRRRRIPRTRTRSNGTESLRRSTLGDIIREEYESLPEPAEGEPTIERLEKRQKYLKEEIEEIKNLIQEAIDKRGGLQPQRKLAVVNEPDGKADPQLTEIGKELAKKVAQEKELDRNDVQEFFAKRGFPRSKGTVLNKMKQISGAQNQIKFKNDGGRGTGGNQPSKLINDTAF